MLHELLLALLIGLHRRPNQESTRSRMLLTIERIIKLGFCYRELDRVATKSRNLIWIRSSNESPLSKASQLLKEKKGRAIANGVVEVLPLYRSAVLHIEQKLLSDSPLILATVTQGPKKPLKNIYVVQSMYENNFVDLDCLNYRLLWHGHQVMYNQLASWMIYGIHHDQYGEFFMSSKCNWFLDIQDLSATRQILSPVPVETLSFIRDESRDAEHDSPPDMIERLASTSNSDFLTNWHSCFHISLDTWPEHRPMRVAESIFYAGKAVRVLGNSSPAIRIQGATSYQQMSRESQRLQVCTMRNTSKKDSPSENKPIGQELHPQSDADKIENMLQNLKLVVVHAALNGHLKALKDYFLLAKGNFFQKKLGAV
ncbi:hypothetical protein ACH5RR_010799 [Cinchona calisaya]|uniref:Gamma-tubulin complex component n=1 Tax=Cinchona calisaya TaxID=153742 RepID=A0ABD3AJX9_9GENT